MAVALFEETYLLAFNQSRLNHLMTLTVHKELTDMLDLAACANDFVLEMNTGSLCLADFINVILTTPI